jgi:adenylate kinase
MRYLILGPPASGKGTQAALLSKEFGIAHISMGDRLRQEAATHTAIGRRIKEHLDRGELVPDDLTLNIAHRAIENAHSQFIFDGFPRTLAQAGFLDNLTAIERMIVLTVSDKSAIERISGRRLCPKGHTFHIKYHPPKREGICDECGLPLSARSDDTPATIIKRLREFHTLTKPLIEHYKDRVVMINGDPPILEVHTTILKALHRR